MGEGWKRAVAAAKKSRLRLTPALCRRQETYVIIENFNAAQAQLRWHRAGNYVGASTLARAQKYYEICRAELLKRGISKEDLDYEPEAAIAVGETVSEGAGSIEIGGSASPANGAEAPEPDATSGPGTEL